MGGWVGGWFGGGKYRLSARRDGDGGWDGRLWGGGWVDENELCCMFYGLVGGWEEGGLNELLNSLWVGG